MKLVIQIPCFNEAESLASVLADIPTTIDGFSEVAVLVIDDGSTDDTALVARHCGVEWLIRHRTNRGLAAAFSSGLDAAIRLGADVIINLDADGQYPASEIQSLVRPILCGKADMVIGDRRPGDDPRFSTTKRWLQRVGSRLVSRWVHQTIPDAVSGFRAFTRDAAARLNVTTSFSYTLETIFQAAHLELGIVHVPIATRSTSRPSRLSSSTGMFVLRSAATIIKLQVVYRPLAFLLPASVILLVSGTIPIARFLYLALLGHSDGHIQSLVLGATLFLCGVVVTAIAVIAECLSLHRKLLHRTLTHLRQISPAWINPHKSSTMSLAELEQR